VVFRGLALEGESRRHPPAQRSEGVPRLVRAGEVFEGSELPCSRPGDHRRPLRTTPTGAPAALLASGRRCRSRDWRPARGPRMTTSHRSGRTGAGGLEDELRGPTLRLPPASQSSGSRGSAGLPTSSATSRSATAAVGPSSELCRGAHLGRTPALSVTPFLSGGPVRLGGLRGLSDQHKCCLSLPGRYRIGS
jgi:hypothetical protein